MTAAALALGAGLPVSAAQEPPTLAVPTIVTTGEAIVRRAPDRAFVTAAVESRARSPRDAQRQNAEAMTAVRQAVAAAGISKDAVRTVGYHIQQEVDFVNGRRAARGYVARNAVEVRVDALERLGELIDAVVAAGATAVGGIRFDLQDRPGAEREALRRPSSTRGLAPKPRPRGWDDRSIAFCGSTTPVATGRHGPSRCRWWRRARRCTPTRRRRSRRAISKFTRRRP